MSLRRIVHELLKKKEYKELPLSQKMILSLFSVHSDVKSIFSQFIFEEFTSIFDYQQDDLLKIHSFIKVASWHIPVAVFSDQNINIINTVCSIASFYGVDIMVIETPKANISHKHRKNLKQENLQLIREAASKGSWLLISDLKMLDYWPDIIEMLQELGTSQKIMNSFRLLLDCQDIEYHELAVKLLTENAIVYHLCNENMEDMEGFNDIWANLLENIVNVDNIINMTMSEKEDSKAVKIVQNLKLGSEFNREALLNILEDNDDWNKGTVSYSIDDNVRNDVLNISNLSVIKKLNESRAVGNESLFDASQRFLDQVHFEESYLEGTKAKKRR